MKSAFTITSCVMLLASAPATLIPTRLNHRPRNRYSRHITQKDESAPAKLRMKVTDRKLPIRSDAATVLDTTRKKTSFGRRIVNAYSVTAFASPILIQGRGFGIMCSAMARKIAMVARKAI